MKINTLWKLKGQASEWSLLVSINLYLNRSLGLWFYFLFEVLKLIFHVLCNANHYIVLLRSVFFTEIAIIFIYNVHPSWYFVVSFSFREKWIFTKILSSSSHYCCTNCERQNILLIYMLCIFFIKNSFNHLTINLQIKIFL